MAVKTSGPQGEPDDMVEVLGGEAASRRLARTYLVKGQQRTRAVFATLFGITQVAAALLVASVLVSDASPALVGGWAALVTFANIWVHGRATAEPPGHRQALERDWRPIAEGLLLAALWIVLPAWGFSGQELESRVVLAGATVAVIVSAVGLAAMPAAAIAFMAVLVTGLGAALLRASNEVAPVLTLTFAGIATVAVLTVTRISRWTFDQLRRDAEARAESESVRLLLNEYEDRGVGWLWQTDADHRILYISSRMGRLLGRAGQTLIGRAFAPALGGGDRLDEALRAGRPFADLDMEVRTREGRRWIRLAGDPIPDRAGGLLGFRGVGHDITDVRNTHERLTQIANLDMLCGLPNRGRMRQLIGEALARCGSEDAPCALLLVDLDAFKPVNDRFGHPKGDLVLKGVAQRLLAQVVDHGHVGRIGGDEFAVILCDTADRREVRSIAERLIASLSEPFYLDGVEVRIGASIGCALGPADASAVDDLIQKADLALYQAKAEGRGTCRFFNAALQAEAEERERLGAELRQGIRTDQLQLAFLPLVEAGSGQLAGFEALVRWHHPEKGVLPPGDFMPLAEECGAAVSLGQWAIDEACRALACWPDLVMAVNLSGCQLAQPDLPEVIRAALKEHRVAPERLQLDVPESVFLGDVPIALERLRALRALGVAIALDDFGTGRSSIASLNRSVFDMLKIDGTLVRDAGVDDEPAAIIRSVVTLARTLNLAITAEGVETEEDLARVRDLGCQRVQGFLFGRPLDFHMADRQARRMLERATA